MMTMMIKELSIQVKIKFKKYCGKKWNEFFLAFSFISSHFALKFHKVFFSVPCITQVFYKGGLVNNHNISIEHVIRDKTGGK